MNQNEQALLDKMDRKAASKIDANWKSIADVDWGDMEHFLEVARRTKKPDAFDTAMRVLVALKRQVTT